MEVVGIEMEAAVVVAEQQAQNVALLVDDTGRVLTWAICGSSAESHCISKNPSHGGVSISFPFPVFQPLF